MYSIFDDLFNSLGFGDFNIYPQYSEEKKCPVCGRTYSDFQRSGKAGCGECYKAFRPQMEQVLKQIHQNPVHTGKIPSKSGEAIRAQRELKRLKDELSAAVKNEDYEKAAILHKQIRQMEGGVK